MREGERKRETWEREKNWNMGGNEKKKRRRGAGAGSGALAQRAWASLQPALERHTGKGGYPATLR
jgi:hypothetical protein